MNKSPPFQLLFLFAGRTPNAKALCARVDRLGPPGADPDILLAIQEEMKVLRALKPHKRLEAAAAFLAANPGSVYTTPFGKVEKAQATLEKLGEAQPWWARSAFSFVPEPTLHVYVRDQRGADAVRQWKGVYKGRAFEGIPLEIHVLARSAVSRKALPSNTSRATAAIGHFAMAYSSSLLALDTGCPFGMHLTVDHRNTPSRVKWSEPVEMHREGDPEKLIGYEALVEQTPPRFMLFFSSNHGSWILYDHLVNRRHRIEAATSEEALSLASRWIELGLLWEQA